MLELFGDIKHILSSQSNCQIDGLILKLHYRVTCAILLGACITLAARQFVGNPISCIFSPEIPEEVFNTYCWIHSTYTVVSALTKKIGVEVAYLGVDNSRHDREETKTCRFYQWVSFCLLFQSLFRNSAYWIAQCSPTGSQQEAVEKCQLDMPWEKAVIPKKTVCWSCS
ncbi:hypothetical protein M8J77_013722 [Diaphorina citri]|nr:hypothetical protein M8J77_013722 [Diaphorina citri]